MPDKAPGGRTAPCACALVVADAWQGRGIGSNLLRKLIDVARNRGVPELFGEILATNHGMLMMVKKLGFHTERHPEDATVTRATLALNEAESGEDAR